MIRYIFFENHKILKKRLTWLMITIADNLSDRFDFDELAPEKTKVNILQIYHTIS